jgi:hypothetical protein
LNPTDYRLVLAAILFGLRNSFDQIYYPAGYGFSLNQLDENEREAFTVAVLSSRTCNLSLPGAASFPDLFGDGEYFSPVKGNNGMSYITPNTYHTGMFEASCQDAMRYIKESGIKLWTPASLE